MSQQYNLIPHLTVAENVLGTESLAGRQVPRDAVAGMLARFGLADERGTSASALSGGEQQRLALCRAMLLGPAVVFLDEPTGALVGAAIHASGRFVAQRELVDAAMTTGLTAGVAHGCAVLTPRITCELVQRGTPNLLPDSEKERVRARFDTPTPRERDSDKLIADGLSNAEIVDRLVLEPTSIRCNVIRILTEFHLRDRVQLAGNWYRISQQPPRYCTPST